jgi:hypothetical protein
MNSIVARGAGDGDEAVVPVDWLRDTAVLVGA